MSRQIDLAKPVENSVLSYQDAAIQAANLRRQGVPFVKIAEHLKATGYLSPFTKSPVSHLTVRNMVMAAEGMERKRTPTKTQAAAPMQVSSPKGEALSNIRQLLAVAEMPVDLQFEMLKYFVSKVK